MIPVFLVTVFLRLGVPARADGTDDYIKAEMEKRHIPGLSVAVVRDGKIVKMQGYGLANVELDVPATENTVYEIGSITKQFTATVVMQLIGENKLGLEDKITKRLSGLPDAWKDVTIRHLLTHTSGIKSYTSLPAFGRMARSEMSHDEILRSVFSAPLDFPPGERFAYNNTGYFLLGMLLEKLEGKPYGEILRARIFGPLGMTATRVNDLRAVIPHRANGYAWQNDTLANGEYTSMSWPFAAGVLVSTVTDMAKWEAALAANKILSRSVLEQMTTSAKLTSGKPTGYGFGWGVGEQNGRRRISHSGGIPGFTGDISRFTDDGITVIVLTNSETADPASLSPRIAGLYVSALAPVAARPIEDRDPKTTQGLKGVLQSIVAGKIDPARFTPEMRAFLASAGGRQATRSVQALGPLGAFDLLDRREDGGKVTLRYRAVFGTTPLICSVALGADSKISTLLLSPE